MKPDFGPGVRLKGRVVGLKHFARLKRGLLPAAGVVEMHWPLLLWRTGYPRHSYWHREFAHKPPLFSSLTTS